MKTIILISHFYKEPFLENEIEYLGKKENLQLVMMPTSQSDYEQFVPKNATIDILLVNTFQNIFIRLLFMFKSLYYKNFYIEFKTQVIHNPKKLVRALYSYARYLFYKKELEEYIKLNSDKDLIFYTYWYNEITYALQSLKQQYNFKLIYLL